MSDTNIIPYFKDRQCYFKLIVNSPNSTFLVSNDGKNWVVVEIGWFVLLSWVSFFINQINRFFIPLLAKWNCSTQIHYDKLGTFFISPGALKFWSGGRPGNKFKKDCESRCLRKSVIDCGWLVSEAYSKAVVKRVIPYPHWYSGTLLPSYPLLINCFQI
jgi:hypothetical protein